MAHDDQFTGTGPSNVGSGFPRASFSDNNQSGRAPQDFVGGVNVQGSQFGVYGECLPSGAIANAPTDRVPPFFTGVSGRGLSVGTWGEGPIAGLVGTSLRDKDPNLKTNTVFVACLAGLQNEDNKNSALIGVFGQGSMIGVLGTAAGAGLLSPPTFGDGVIGMTGVLDSPNVHGAGVHGVSFDPLGRGGVFESAGIAQVSLTPAPQGSKLPTVGVQGDLFTRQEANVDGAPEVGLYLCIRSNGVPPQNAPANWQKVQLNPNVLLGGS